MAILIRALTLVVLAAMAMAAPCNEAADEPELRAAMVYNLLTFAEWPRGGVGAEETGFQFCAVTTDAETKRAFARLAGKRLKDRPLKIVILQPLAQTDGCRAILFDDLEAGLTADKLAALGNGPILTIAVGASRVAGVMVALELSGRRLVFDVDQTALKRAGLSLPARVLQLARQVHK